MNNRRRTKRTALATKNKKQYLSEEFTKDDLICSGCGRRLYWYDTYAIKYGFCSVSCGNKTFCI